MLTGLLLLLALAADERDPAQVPPGERVALVNRLADRLSGENANDQYALAQEHYVQLFKLSLDASSDDERKAFDDVDRRLPDLLLAAQWTTPEARALRAWLKANARTLQALEAATRMKRCFQPLDAARLGKSAADLTAVHLRQLAKLAGVAANDCALRGEWSAAYDWSVRRYCIANHAYQQPFVLQQMVAMSIDRDACDQCLVFLQHHAPDDPRSLLVRVAAGDEFRAPSAVIDYVTRLWTRDDMEVWHEWARQPERHPDLSELAETFTQTDELLKDVRDVLGASPYRSVAELRAALLAGSVDQDWILARQIDDVTARWCALPFDRAWHEVGEFERAYCELTLKAPSLAMSGCGQLASSQFRLLSEETAMRRAALVCVMGIQEFRRQRGSLPDKLEDLVPLFVKKETLIDPFSGRPFVYRTTSGGSAFTLYSVGSDQVDDGGRPASEFRAAGDQVFWPPAAQTP
jgi:hypothetical protein